MNLQPVQPELTLDEAIALACAGGDVVADQLDSAWLNTPLARRAAAAEREREQVDLEPPDPSRQREFIEYDEIVQEMPDACMWELSFGRMEYLDPEESAWQCEKTFRILGKDVPRSLPAIGANRLDPDVQVAFHPALPFGRALDLAAEKVGMPRAIAHGGWYETARMIPFHEHHGSRVENAPRDPHWRFEFGIVQTLLDDGFVSNPSGTARVFDDGRVEARRYDWNRILRQHP